MEDGFQPGEADISHLLEPRQWTGLISLHPPGNLKCVGGLSSPTFIDTAGSGKFSHSPWGLAVPKWRSWKSAPALLASQVCSAPELLAQEVGLFFTVPLTTQSVWSLQVWREDALWTTGPAEISFGVQDTKAPSD